MILVSVVVRKVRKKLDRCTRFESMIKSVFYGILIIYNRHIDIDATVINILTRIINVPLEYRLSAYIIKLWFLKNFKHGINTWKTKDNI